MKTTTRKQQYQKLSKAICYQEAINIAIETLTCIASGRPPEIHRFYSGYALKSLKKMAKLIKPRK